MCCKSSYIIIIIVHNASCCETYSMYRNNNNNNNNTILNPFSSLENIYRPYQKFIDIPMMTIYIKRRVDFSYIFTFSPYYIWGRSPYSSTSTQYDLSCLHNRRFSAFYLFSTHIFFANVSSLLEKTLKPCQNIL